jgi:hypothetical protein
MRLMLFAVVLFAGCLPEEEDDIQPAEGDHLIVHVVSDAQFDHLDITLDNVSTFEQFIQLGAPTGVYDYDHWETLSGSGPRHVGITVQNQGVTVARGDATDITYVAVGDGSNRATITMHLAP